MTRYLADFSLSLINRTGAYYICRDLLEGLPHAFAGVRYWRMRAQAEPPPLARRLLGRAMLFEIEHLRHFAPQRPSPEQPVLFLDPLYVLLSSLSERDIVLCHDIGPISHPDLFDPGTTAAYRDAYDKIATVKPQMVFVSVASRDAFAARYGAAYPSLDVIPLYVRANIDVGDARAPEGVRLPFLLTVGGLETRKNHERALAAFAASGLHRAGYAFIMCGPRGNSAVAVERAAAATPGAKLFGYLADAELRWLYRHATAFVLPSLLEGFGVPALEAARYGLVSVLSAGGALEEATGGAALLVDPHSVESIADGMACAVSLTPAERERLAARAKSRADELTLDLYLSRWARRLGVER